MAPSDQDLYVTVTLRDVDNSDAIPERSIILKSPDWQVKIGRGTLSNQEDLWPAEQNAWFDSRVMSRNHAVLQADPASKEILIEDVGSMHGTYIGSRRLKSKRLTPLWPRDTVVLGADVTRGAACFSALRVMVTWSWSDGSADHPASGDKVLSNTFSADYSDEELYEETSSDIHEDAHEDVHDDAVYEIEDDGEGVQVEDSIVHLSVREPSVEFIPTRTFAVPGSDVSESGSYASGDPEVVEESPTSSPILLSDTKFIPDTVIDIEKDGATTHHPWSSSAKPTGTDSLSHNDARIGRIEVVSLMDDISEVGFYDDETNKPRSDGEPMMDISGPSHEMPEEHMEAPTLESAFGSEANPSTDASVPSKTVRPDTIQPFAAPPFIQHPAQPTFAPDNTTSHLKTNSAWAGHNSILYDPVPFNPTKLSPADVICVYPSPQQLGREIQSIRYDFSAPPFQMSQHQPDQSRISIANIVDQAPLEDSKGSKLSSTLKRKADLISSEIGHEETPGPSDDVAKNATLPFSPASLVETSATASREREEPFAEENISSLATVNATSTTVSLDPDQPPRKRAKKNKHKSSGERGSDSNGFVKIAAATIAGVAIGAVGTIIGLAALPADYFV